MDLRVRWESSLGDGEGIHLRVVLSRVELPVEESGVHLEVAVSPFADLRGRDTPGATIAT